MKVIDPKTRHSRFAYLRLQVPQATALQLVRCSDSLRRPHGHADCLQHMYMYSTQFELTKVTLLDAAYCTSSTSTSVCQMTNLDHDMISQRKAPAAI